MRDGTDYNTGFFIIKNNEKTIKFLENITIRCDTERPYFADQSILNETIHELKHDGVSGDSLIFGDVETINNRDEIIFHHATGAETTDEKMMQLKKIYNLMTR